MERKELQSFVSHVGDYIEVAATEHFSSIWMKFLESLKGLADPWKTVIKQYLEKELVVEDISAAYTYTGEMDHYAIRADPRLPIIPGKNFEFDADPSVVKATDGSFDCLVKQQNAIDLLSDEQKLEYAADLRDGNLPDANQLLAIQKNRQQEKPRHTLFERQIEEASDARVRQLQIFWQLKDHSPAYYASVSRKQKSGLEKYIKDVKSRRSRQFQDAKAAASLPFESTSDFPEDSHMPGIVSASVSRPLALRHAIKKSRLKPAAQTQKAVSKDQPISSHARILRPKPSPVLKKAYELSMSISDPSMAKRALYMLFNVHVDELSHAQSIKRSSFSTLAISEEGTSNVRRAQALAKPIRWQFDGFKSDTQCLVQRTKNMQWSVSTWCRKCRLKICHE